MDSKKLTLDTCKSIYDDMAMVEKIWECCNAESFAGSASRISYHVDFYQEHPHLIWIVKWCLGNEKRRYEKEPTAINWLKVTNMEAVLKGIAQRPGLDEADQILTEYLYKEYQMPYHYRLNCVATSLRKETAKNAKETKPLGEPLKGPSWRSLRLCGESLRFPAFRRCP